MEVVLSTARSLNAITKLLDIKPTSVSNAEVSDEDVHATQQRANIWRYRKRLNLPWNINKGIRGIIRKFMPHKAVLAEIRKFAHCELLLAMQLENHTPSFHIQAKTLAQLTELHLPIVVNITPLPDSACIDCAFKNDTGGSSEYEECFLEVIMRTPKSLRNITRLIGISPTVILKKGSPIGKPGFAVYHRNILMYRTKPLRKPWNVNRNIPPFIKKFMAYKTALFEINKFAKCDFSIVMYLEKQSSSFCLSNKLLQQVTLLDWDIDVDIILLPYYRCTSCPHRV